MDLSVRAIADGITVEGNCGANFSFNGVPIGLSTPCDGVVVLILVLMVFRLVSVHHVMVRSLILMQPTSPQRVPLMLPALRLLVSSRFPLVV